MTPLVSGIDAYEAPAASASMTTLRTSRRPARRPTAALSDPLETPLGLRFMCSPANLLCARNASRFEGLGALACRAAAAVSTSTRTVPHQEGGHNWPLGLFGVQIFWPDSQVFGLRFRERAGR